MGTSTVVRRALRLIEDGALDDASVEILASRVGIGARQLDRLFLQHVGASPITVAQTRRLHFAKRLLDETTLPITEIALAAGFGSLRRFNDAFLKTYGRPPRDLRRQKQAGGAAEPSDEVVLRLAYRPPYDWRAMSDALAARAIPGVERVDARGYARTVAIDGGHAFICVRPLDRADALELRACGAAPAALFQLSATARRVFDLASDPARVELALQGDPLLGPLVKRRPGLRIPGAWDPFECAVRATLARHMGRALAPTSIQRIVAWVGAPIAGGRDGLTHLFPTPAAMASARLDGLGLDATSVDALRALARVAAEGAFDVEAPEHLTEALAALPEVGPRAAQEVALLALGDPDAFPASDVILRRTASPAVTPLTERELERRAEAWRPWRGYAAAHLLRAATSAAHARAEATQIDASSSTRSLRTYSPSASAIAVRTRPTVTASASRIMRATGPVRTAKSTASVSPAEETQIGVSRRSISTRVNPATPRTSRSRASDAKAKGPGAPGSAAGNGATTVSAARRGTRYQGLSSTERQHTMQSRPPERSAVRKFANAADGSTKNIDPKRE
jgi:AraC family transcriptional regulator of adaptative response / DNA-3-methyladenine glycosylase II